MKQHKYLAKPTSAGLWWVYTNRYQYQFEWCGVEVSDDLMCLHFTGDEQYHKIVDGDIAWEKINKPSFNPNSIKMKWQEPALVTIGGFGWLLSEIVRQTKEKIDKGSFKIHYTFEARNANKT